MAGKIDLSGNHICTTTDGLVFEIFTYNKKEMDMTLWKGREPELLPHISSHILRHTACTRMAEQGMDVKVLQYIMGHSDISVTMNVYNHVDAVRVESETQ